MKETEYSHRTDSVEEKIRLLRDVLARGRYDQARSLAESIKDTIVFTQQVSEDPGPPDLAPGGARRVDELPEPWRRWAKGWTHYEVLALDETVGMPRAGEPIELAAAFPSHQTTMLSRELRLARVDSSTGTLTQTPCQVIRELRRGEQRLCGLLFQADSAAHVRSHYLVFWGNPDAELPDYASDLKVRGEGYGLEIENRHYRASLSRQMGQIERLTYKQGGRELFAAGDGHGEPPGIDWAHDYVTSGAFQKMRVTNWADCPDYEVIRGPACAIVRRWGFPHSTVHPLFTPSRFHINVEYRFYAGLPYFVKRGSMETLTDLEITYLRDDEWVFSGSPFTDMLWMPSDGKLRESPVADESKDDLWAIGFYNRQNRDSFIALFLDHEAENFDGLKHSGAPTLNYMNHGQLWSRWAARGNPTLQAGARRKQRNAYLVSPFKPDGGAAEVEAYRHRLLNPLAAERGDLPDSIRPSATLGSLARSGEAGDASIPKAEIWKALSEVRDPQLYKVNANVVDMGYVYDVRVDTGTVHIVMTMPHRGRPKYRFIGEPIRRRLLDLAGVREVSIENVWDPPWDANRLTDAGRAAMGF